MKRLYVDVLADGCIESFLDFARSRMAFELGGWTLCDKVEDADLVLTNSCVVGQLVEDRCAELILALKKRLKPGAELVVTGCMPAYNMDRLRKLGVDFAYGARQLESMLDRYSLAPPPEASVLEKRYLGPYNKFNWVTDWLQRAANAGIPIPEHIYRGFAGVEMPDLYYLRINRGCLQACTYCATRFTVGKLTSNSVEQILCRFDKALAEGHRKFALCGEETGAFGLDRGEDFPTLLEKLLARRVNFQVHIRQHHPKYIIARLQDYRRLLADPRIASITIPLQSGSDRILGLMRRQHTAAEARRMILGLHEAAAHLILRTHLILGFPTETDGDFRESYRLARDLPWDMVLAYPYTNRPGTRAAKMEPKVSTAAIARRAAIIYAMLVGKLYLNDFKRVKLARGNPFALPRVVDEEEIPTGEHQGSDKGPNVGRCAS